MTCTLLNINKAAPLFLKQGSVSSGTVVPLASLPDGVVWYFMSTDAGQHQLIFWHLWHQKEMCCSLLVHLPARLSNPGYLAFTLAVFSRLFMPVAASLLSALQYAAKVGQAL